ncbi:MAG: rhodanese-like domain-containing protein [Microgenomates group bacterium]
MAKQITADDVHTAIGNAEVTIIDVRTPEEVIKGAIKGSVSIPLDELESKIEEQIPDKNRTIYLYCLSGSRSEVAADMLTNRGYSQAFSMSNGLLMWRFKKFELTS